MRRWHPYLIHYLAFIWVNLRKLDKVLKYRDALKVWLFHERAINERLPRGYMVDKMVR